ncbi:MAG: hypothetical protein KF900_04005 [Bacteroidetes bacterium]|nr:hypothetical protein [Bacteroidota bacterium]
MKKNWLIILIHLGLQTLIGVLSVVWAQDKFAGDTLAGLGVIFTYVTTAAISILISFLVLLLVNKQNGKRLFFSVILSLAVWSIIIPATLIAGRKVNDEISSAKNRASIKKRLENTNKTLDAVKQMGLSSYTWNAYFNQYDMKTKNGNLHAFLLEDGKLYIYSNALLPAYNDTLSWLKLTLEEASVYLNSNAYKILDSCIRVGKYYFSSRENPLSVDIRISFNDDIGIYGIAPLLHYREKFLITMKYGKQTKYYKQRIKKNPSLTP